MQVFRNWRWGLTAGIAVILLLGSDAEAGNVQVEHFGFMPDGREVDVYVLSNDNGMQVKVSNLGGAVVSIMVPDQSGHPDDVALGFDDVASYYTSNFGSIIGRFANRIADGRFTLDGQSFTLTRNNGDNHIHGGIRGFDDVLWSAKPVIQGDTVGVELSYYSQDGEEGYPGNLFVRVVYSLGAENNLSVEYKAVTDQKTVVNLTNHSYFNLQGEGTGKIGDHVIHFPASRYLEVNREMIPTGEMKSVQGTPMDFTDPHAIGERIDQDYPALNYGMGYDHFWVLDKPAGKFGLAARVIEPTSGRVMEIYTTEPGVQFYTGNHMDGNLVGKSGVPYTKRSGFALEVQHHPDAPNHPDFPSTVLESGEMYTQKTVYKFRVQ